MSDPFVDSVLQEEPEHPLVTAAIEMRRRAWWESAPLMTEWHGVIHGRDRHNVTWSEECNSISGEIPNGT